MSRLKWEYDCACTCARRYYCCFFDDCFLSSIQIDFAKYTCTFVKLKVSVSHHATPQGRTNRSGVRRQQQQPDRDICCCYAVSCSYQSNSD